MSLGERSRALALIALGSAPLASIACSAHATPFALPIDAAIDSPDAASDAALADSAPPIPVCTKNAIGGSCDLVSQNCPNAGEECVAVTDNSGTRVTSCQSEGTGSIVEGDFCTPSPSTNPCVPGLECIGSAGSARCARHCCDNDSTACGTSPEGYPGVCSVTVLQSKTQNPIYMLCQYAPPCQPFGLKKCALATQLCSVKDKVGTATCSDAYQPPGKDEGAFCNFANDCRDGMMCIGQPSTCAWVCYQPSNVSPPFDPSKLDLNTPGRGGCPQGKACGGHFQGRPPWLGYCQ